MCALVPFHVTLELQCPPTLSPAKPQREQVLGSAWITEIRHHCSFPPTLVFSPTCPGFTGSEDLLGKGPDVPPQPPFGASAGTTSLSLTQHLPTNHIRFPLLPSQDVPRCVLRLEDKRLGETERDKVHFTAESLLSNRKPSN